MECEGFIQNTETRKVSSCPVQDEFCVTYEERYIEYDEGQNVNGSSDAGWNVVFGKVFNIFHGWSWPMGKILDIIESVEEVEIICAYWEIWT